MTISIGRFAAAVCLVSLELAFGDEPRSPKLIDFHSEHGEQLLVEAEARKDYFLLATHYSAQENRAYCGVASMAMVLNAMEVPAPEVADLAPYKTFTQANVLDDRTDEIVSRATIRSQGMSLDQLAAVLATKPVAASVHHVDRTTLAEFRSQARESLSRSGRFVIVNYFRPALGQEGGGHHSPLAAYHRDSDRFLILDVARYKYPPVWVTADDLFAAMNTRDPDAPQKTRGYVLVDRNRVSAETSPSGRTTPPDSPPVP